MKSSLTVREALPIFYKTYNLENDGGIHEASVRVEFFKGLSIFIPNFETRKKVVLKHDIHHLLTGYSAVMKGETEISAWELSTGCTGNWFAFLINTYGMMSGVLFNLMGIWRAWARGRLSSNLYHERYTMEELLDKPVDGLRAELGLHDAKQGLPTTKTLVSFFGFLVFGTIVSMLSIVLVPFLLIYSTTVSIRKKWLKT